MWSFDKKSEKPKLKNTILIEGLPGIGNVGKIALDFLISETKAVKLFEVSSYSFPHSVFINEKNLVELPSIEIYYRKFDDDRPDLLLLTGDIQPIDEESCYEFCDKMLDIAQEFGCKEVITIGGIGLSEIPKDPKIMCTGNNKKIIAKYKKDTGISDKLYGIVGPIIGVSGLLIGLSKRRNINGICLLAETLGHPAYVAVKEAQLILKILDQKLGLKIDLESLDKEIKDLEKQMKEKAKDIRKISELKSVKSLKQFGDVNYIG